MVNSKIIILNGPPGCGKDIIGHDLCKRIHARHMEFKIPIFSAIFGITGMHHQEWFNRYNDRNLKEVPWDKLGGKSCREMMIFVSEEVCKKIYGKAYYGIKAYKEIAQSRVQDIVFTDGGFAEEIQYLIDRTRHRFDVYVVQVYRTGCSFIKDSRNYLTRDDLNSCYIHAIENVEERPYLAVDKIMEEIFPSYYRRQYNGKNSVGISWN